jgi:hypothetical protein
MDDDGIGIDDAVMAMDAVTSPKTACNAAGMTTVSLLPCNDAVNQSVATSCKRRLVGAYCRFKRASIKSAAADISSGGPAVMLLLL